jgi:hypothetical protein
MCTSFNDNFFVSFIHINIKIHQNKKKYKNSFILAKRGI